MTGVTRENENPCDGTEKFIPSLIQILPLAPPPLDNDDDANIPVPLPCRCIPS